MARVLTACLTALALGGLAACADGDAGGDGSRAIAFQLFGDPEELALYRELARAYERERGGKVRLIAVGDRKDHLAKLAASFAARRPPDVFLLNYRNLGGFASRRAVVPVGPLVARPGGLETDEFYPVTTRAFTIAGRLQCLPQNASSLVVYFNVDAFREAGVAPPPRRGWRYAEFMAAARRLTKEGRFGVALDPNTIRAAPFVWSAGGDLVDDRARPTRFVLDSRAARLGLEALVALRRGGVAPGRREAGAQAADERFLSGGAAMLLSSRRDVPVLRTIRRFTWDVAPFPAIGRPATALHSDGFCLARGGDAAAAWRFVEFAAGPAGQRLLARGGRTVPSLKAVAQSSAFLRSAPPASNRVFLEQIPVMRAMPVAPNWTRIEETADLAIEEAFYGGLSIDEAVARITRETRGLF